MNISTPAADGPVPRFYTLPVTGIIFSLWIYLCTLIMAAVGPRYVTAGRMRDLMLLLPLFTTLLVIAVIYGVYRASDDDIRHRILKCAALTGAILAFGTLGYFCLERLGFPPLSMIVVNLCGWSTFTLLILGVLFRAR